MKYAFIQAYRDEFRLSSICRVLKFHRSGYYAWLKTPLSLRSIVSKSLSKQIWHFYDLSNGIYGSPSIFMDLKEAGLYLAVVIDLHF